jgi:hypothetical protein
MASRTSSDTENCVSGILEKSKCKGIVNVVTSGGGDKLPKKEIAAGDYVGRAYREKISGKGQLPDDTPYPSHR